MACLVGELASRHSLKKRIIDCTSFMVVRLNRHLSSGVLNGA